VGTIKEIEETDILYRLKVVFGKNQQTFSEIPKKEFSILGIKVGDKVQLFPIDNNSYLVVGNS